MAVTTTALLACDRKNMARVPVLSCASPDTLCPILPTTPPRVRTQISLSGAPATARSTVSLVYVTMRLPEGRSSQTLRRSEAVATTT